MSDQESKTASKRRHVKIRNAQYKYYGRELKRAASKRLKKKIKKGSKNHKRYTRIKKHFKANIFQLPLLKRVLAAANYGRPPMARGRGGYAGPGVGIRRMGGGGGGGARGGGGGNRERGSGGPPGISAAGGSGGSTGPISINIGGSGQHGYTSQMTPKDYWDMLDGMVSNKIKTKPSHTFNTRMYVPGGGKSGTRPWPTKRRQSKPPPPSDIPPPPPSYQPSQREDHPYANRRFRDIFPDVEDQSTTETETADEDGPPPPGGGSGRSPLNRFQPGGEDNPHDISSGSDIGFNQQPRQRMPPPFGGRPMRRTWQRPTDIELDALRNQLRRVTMEAPSIIPTRPFEPPPPPPPQEAIAVPAAEEDIPMEVPENQLVTRQELEQMLNDQMTPMTAELQNIIDNYMPVRREELQALLEDEGIGIPEAWNNALTQHRENVAEAMATQGASIEDNVRRVHDEYFQRFLREREDLTRILDEKLAAQSEAIASRSRASMEEAKAHIQTLIPALLQDNAEPYKELVRRELEAATAQYSRDLEALRAEQEKQAAIMAGIDIGAVNNIPNVMTTMNRIGHNQQAAAARMNDILAQNKALTEQGNKMAQEQQAMGVRLAELTPQRMREIADRIAAIENRPLVPADFAELVNQTPVGQEVAAVKQHMTDQAQKLREMEIEFNTLSHNISAGLVNLTPETQAELNNLARNHNILADHLKTISANQDILGARQSTFTNKINQIDENQQDFRKNLQEAHELLTQFHNVHLPGYAENISRQSNEQVAKALEAHNLAMNSTLKNLEDKMALGQTAGLTDLENRLTQRLAAAEGGAAQQQNVVNEIGTHLNNLHTTINDLGLKPDEVNKLRENVLEHRNRLSAIEAAHPVPHDDLVSAIASALESHNSRVTSNVQTEIARQLEGRINPTNQPLADELARQVDIVHRGSVRSAPIHTKPMVLEQHPQKAHSTTGLDKRLQDAERVLSETRKADEQKRLQQQLISKMVPAPPTVERWELNSTAPNSEAGSVIPASELSSTVYHMPTASQVNGPNFRSTKGMHTQNVMNQLGKKHGQLSSTASDRIAVQAGRSKSKVNEKLTQLRNIPRELSNISEENNSQVASTAVTPIPTVDPVYDLSPAAIAARFGPAVPQEASTLVQEQAPAATYQGPEYAPGSYDPNTASTIVYDEPPQQVYGPQTAQAASTIVYSEPQPSTSYQYQSPMSRPTAQTAATEIYEEPRPSTSRYIEPMKRPSRAEKYRMMVKQPIPTSTETGEYDYVPPQTEEYYVDAPQAYEAPIAAAAAAGFDQPVFYDASEENQFVDAPPPQVDLGVSDEPEYSTLTAPDDSYISEISDTPERAQYFTSEYSGYGDKNVGIPDVGTFAPHLTESPYAATSMPNYGFGKLPKSKRRGHRVLAVHGKTHSLMNKAHAYYFKPNHTQNLKLDDSFKTIEGHEARKFLADMFKHPDEVKHGWLARYTQPIHPRFDPHDFKEGFLDQFFSHNVPKCKHSPNHSFTTDRLREIKDDQHRPIYEFLFNRAKHNAHNIFFDRANQHMYLSDGLRHVDLHHTYDELPKLLRDEVPLKGAAIGSVIDYLKGRDVRYKQRSVPADGEDYLIKYHYEQ